MFASHDYHRALALPENPLPRSLRLPEDTDQNDYHILRPEDVLNQATLRCFRGLGLKACDAALFYKKPGSLGIIHTDVSLEGGRWRKNVAAVNWNLSGADSVMRWYDVKTPGTEPDASIAEEENEWYRTLNGIHYGFVGSKTHKNLPKNKVRLLSDSPISLPTLVRTNVPHNVENTDANKGRWALSVRFEHDFDCWAEAVDAFRPLLVPAAGLAA
ncbi:MAG: hypothetical protein HS117_22500 [Verrucomicrobiaceae bacterium]|nr:hypothetical protein [Verrucomicrobiaceae bacterium]